MYAYWSVSSTLSPIPAVVLLFQVARCRQLRSARMGAAKAAEASSEVPFAKLKSKFLGLKQVYRRTQSENNQCRGYSTWGRMRYRQHCSDPIAPSTLARAKDHERDLLITTAKSASSPTKPVLVANAMDSGSRCTPRQVHSPSNSVYISQQDPALPKLQCMASFFRYPLTCVRTASARFWRRGVTRGEGTSSQLTDFAPPSKSALPPVPTALRQRLARRQVSTEEKSVRRMHSEENELGEPSVCNASWASASKAPTLRCPSVKVKSIADAPAAKHLETSRLKPEALKDDITQETARSDRSKVRSENLFLSEMSKTGNALEDMQAPGQKTHEILVMTASSVMPSNKVADPKSGTGAFSRKLEPRGDCSSATSSCSSNPSSPPQQNASFKHIGKAEQPSLLLSWTETAQDSNYWPAREQARWEPVLQVTANAFSAGGTPNFGTPQRHQEFNADGSEECILELEITDESHGSESDIVLSVNEEEFVSGCFSVARGDSTTQNILKKTCIVSSKHSEDECMEFECSAEDECAASSRGSDKDFPTPQILAHGPSGARASVPVVATSIERSPAEELCQKSGGGTEELASAVSSDQDSQMGKDTVLLHPVLSTLQYCGIPDNWLADAPTKGLFCLELESSAALPLDPNRLRLKDECKEALTSPAPLEETKKGPSEPDSSVESAAQCGDPLVLMESEQRLSSSDVPSEGNQVVRPQALVDEPMERAWSEERSPVDPPPGVFATSSPQREGMGLLKIRQRRTPPQSPTSEASLGEVDCGDPSSLLTGRAMLLVESDAASSNGSPSNNSSKRRAQQERRRTSGESLPRARGRPSGAETLNSPPLLEDDEWEALRARLAAPSERDTAALGDGLEACGHEHGRHFFQETKSCWAPEPTIATLDEICDTDEKRSNRRPVSFTIDPAHGDSLPAGRLGAPTASFPHQIGRGKFERKTWSGDSDVSQVISKLKTALKDKVHGWWRQPMTMAVKRPLMSSSQTVVGNVVSKCEEIKAELQQVGLGTDATPPLLRLALKAPIYRVFNIFISSSSSKEVDFAC